jgi:hypothetical protein
METEGLFVPETAAEGHGRHDSLDPRAETAGKQATEATACGSEKVTETLCRRFPGRVHSEVARCAR